MSKKSFDIVLESQFRKNCEISKPVKQIAAPSLVMSVPTVLGPTPFRPRDAYARVPERVSSKSHSK